MRRFLVKRPELKLKVALGDQEREIKWTYGLSNDIQRLVPDAGAAIGDITSQPYIRDYIVRRALTDKKGFVEKEEELISPEEIDDLDPDEVASILDWVSEHLLYFFGNSAGSMSRLAKQFSALLQPLNHSSTGSEDSPSTTPSAGPSE